jgi:hypothetical protein
MRAKAEALRAKASVIAKAKGLRSLRSLCRSIQRRNIVRGRARAARQTNPHKLRILRKRQASCTVFVENL